MIGTQPLFVQHQKGLCPLWTLVEGEQLPLPKPSPSKDAGHAESAIKEELL
jgi:hypothetical protein